MFLRATAAAISMALAACGVDPAGPTAEAGQSPYTLALVGDPDLTLHPGERRNLEVLLAGEDQGPIANARLHFGFQQGEPAGGSLEAEEVATDDSGIAAASFLAGARPAAGPFHVVVTAPGLRAEPVTFRLSVVALRRTLAIVPTPATRVSADEASATTLIGVSSSVGLKVRELDADTGAPIPGDTISFTLPPVANARWSAGVYRTATAQTGAGGKAQVYLVATPAAEGPWQVTAQSIAGGPPVLFNVTVQAAGSCSANAQCAPGQVCTGDPPRCADDGGSSCADPRNPCPPGFACAGGVCEPADVSCDPEAPACGSGRCCDASALVCRDVCPMSCAAGTHCEPADTCGEGSCVPDETVPDVSGIWLTRHDYRIRDALPFTVQETFKALRLMDQTLLGQLTIPGLPGWLQAILNAFVARLLQQYLPGWIQQLIHISDDLATILGNLRSEGAMRLARGADVAHLKGAEVWTSLVFYWLPLCEGEIAGDPGDPPQCARIDVVTSDSGVDETAQCKGEVLPSIQPRLSAFSATVAKRGSAWVLDVGPRQVKLEMGKVLLILVDQLMSVVTAGEYHCIDEATWCAPGSGCIVDCEGLARDVENATDGIVDAGTVQELCGRGVRAVGGIVEEALARAWPITADTLDFSGSATISGIADDGSCDGGAVSGACAARLGKASWDKDLNSSNAAVRDARDGKWTGHFFFRLVERLPGAWEATRPWEY